MGSRNGGTRNFRMMKFGTPPAVGGPGSTSTKPGFAGVGVPSGLRNAATPPPSAGATAPPLSGSRSYQGRGRSRSLSLPMSPGVDSGGGGAFSPVGSSSAGGSAGGPGAGAGHSAAGGVRGGGAGGGSPGGRGGGPRIG